MGTLLRGWRLCAVIGYFALAACSVDKVRFTPDDGDDDGSGGRTTAMVTVQLSGAGHGTIAAQGRDFACGATCTTTVPINSTLTLVAVPDAGAVFGGWTGADCTGDTCAVTASRDLTIGAKFDVQMFTVEVELLGSGMGVVTSSAGGLACPGVCSVQIAYGTQISFAAMQDSSSVFLGWSGDCGDGLCGFTVKEDHHVGATFAKQNELVVVKDGNGGGAVKSDPAGIDCGTDCSEAYVMDTPVALTAEPDADSTFMGWAGGGCAGTGACNVTMAGATQVTATFALQKRTLTIAKTGNGAVTGVGIDCGSDCTQDYDIHSTVMLVAIADDDSTFASWTGAPDCTSSTTCTVKLDSNTTVTAVFALKKRTLTVTKQGKGTGVVTSSPAGINCGAMCSASYDAHTQVTLTAVANASDSVLTSWSVASCGTASTCKVTLDQDTPVTVTFALQSRKLTVKRAGSGTGTVTGTGINCGSNCTQTYDAHTPVTLTAAPNAADSTFTGWSVASCGSALTCTVVLDVDTEVTATFGLQSRKLTVARDGNGSGKVAGLGIDCGSDCQEDYAIHSTLTLTAVPESDSSLVTWSVASCGTALTCTFTLDADTPVKATFALVKRTLAVNKQGNGTGVVTSNPTGINCGATCTASYDAHTPVTLTAAPSADSLLSSWSVASCGGSLTCAVTLDADTVVTATFARKTFALVVSLDGSGTGSVTGSGILCPGDCTESYPSGTVVQLTAVPSGGSTFAGWSGACTGTGACEVTMSEARAVTAKLDPPKGLMLVADYGGRQISTFPVNANGNTVPIRTIAGTSTTLVNPRGLVVNNGEIIQTDQGGRAIDVFPITASGDVLPVRRIAGSTSGIVNPYSVAVYNDEIYVAQFSSPILVFPLNATGDVAPVRTITGAGSVIYLAFADGLIYASDYTAGRIVVFPASQSGPVTPTRVITGLSNPAGIFVHGDEVFVTGLNSNQISVYPKLAQGPAAPSRLIGGTLTQLGFPDQLIVFAGEIYVANYNTRSVVVFPLNANGNVAPSRQITGGSTGLQGPLGVWVF